MSDNFELPADMFGSDNGNWTPEALAADRAELAAEDQERRQQARQTAADKVLTRWVEQIPPRYSKAPDMTRPGYPYAALRAWAKTRPLPNLVMVGDNTRGKTFAAWYMVMWLLHFGVTVSESRFGEARAEPGVFCNSDMWRRIVGDPSAFRRDHSISAEEEARQAGILVLDDIARAGWKADHDPGILYGIVSERIDWQRPTIVTTNNKNLRELFGKAVTSRLMDDIGGNPGVIIDFGSDPTAPQ